MLKVKYPVNQEYIEQLSFQGFRLIWFWYIDATILNIFCRWEGHHYARYLIYRRCTFPIPL
jgi:hypothetical protein